MARLIHGVVDEMSEQDRQGNANDPELSVILVVGGQRERAAATLRSLLEQSAIDRMEIFLFDLGAESAPALPGSEHPRVQLARRGPTYLLGPARAEGMRAAKAPVISLIEEHCMAQPGWAEAVIRAHQGPWAAVGCGFTCANSHLEPCSKAFRITYGDYIHTGRHERGPVNFVSGQNSSFKRDVLLRYDDQLELMMTADLVLQSKMLEDGYKLFYEPSARMTHLNERLISRLCAGAFYWNWCFSNARAQVFQWSWTRKAIWIVLAPLIPWVRLTRLSILVSRMGGRKFVRFLCDLPSILAVDYASAAGQVAGLLNKIDIGAREFCDFELNEPRPSGPESV